MYKHLGLVSIVLMWIGTYLLLRKHSPDSHKTISKHASKNSTYQLAYGIVEITVVGIFYLFIFDWFIPNFKLDSVYAAVSIIGAIGVVIAALIADRPGWMSRIHSIGAYGMAVALLAMNLLLLFSPMINSLTRLSLIVAITYMVLGFTIAIISPHVYKNNALKLQIVYFLAFQLPVLIAVYT